MRILHLGKYYWPHYGGMESALKDLAEAAVSLGHQTTCVVANQPRIGAKTEIIEGVEVERLQCFGKILSTPLAPAIMSRDLNSYDLVHPHLPNPLAEIRTAIELLRHKNFSKKLLPYFHAMPVGQGFLGKLWFRSITRFLLARSAKILVSNPNFLGAFPELREFEPKIVIVPFSAHVAAPPAEKISVKIEQLIKNPKGVLFLGRLVPYKGADLLVKAWARMRELGIQAPPLWIAGDGPERERLLAMVEQNKLAPQVLFTGPVNDAEKTALFRAALFFVAPSRTTAETFGISILEAMSHGLAVLTSNLPTGVRILARAGDCGAICEPNDLEGIARGLERLIREEAWRAQAGDSNRQFVESNYSRSALKSNYAKILASASTSSIAP